MPTHPDFPGCRVYRRGNSPFWYVEFPDGTRKSSGLRDERAAWAFIRDQLRRTGQPSWKILVGHFLATKAPSLKPATMHQYSNSIRVLHPFLGDLFVPDITVEVLKGFVLDRRQKVTDASVRRDLATGSAVFTHAQETLPAQMPDVNPFRMLSKRHLREVKRRRFLTEDEYARIEAALREEWHRVALEVFVYTGMRHGEVRAFRKDWIDWDQDLILLPEEHAKNGEPRVIPLFPKFRRTLEDWCARSPGPYVFTGPKGQPYTSFQGFWVLARGRAGVKDVRIHDLRHTFASWWMQRGGNLLALKELLGHADLRMVERYAHLNTEAQRRAVTAMGDVMKRTL